jgi:hypothetical protein
MKIIFHEKADVNGSDSEEEITFICLHLLNKLFISFDES